MVEHIINSEQHIQRHHIVILSTKLRNIDHIIRELTGFELNPREDGVCLSK
jgi:hypothetical protein